MREQNFGLERKDTKIYLFKERETTTSKNELEQHNFLFL